MGVFDLGPPASGGGDIDRDEVVRAFVLLADPAHGVELTALPSGRKLYGAGDDPEALADLAAQLVGGSGVYLVANPVPPGLGRGAKAAEVVYYRWLFLDIDAVKAVGFEDDPATDEECAAAGRLAFTIQSYLMAKGWPAPLVVTSGNGRYLLFRLEMPNDKQTRALVAACVRALAKRYDGSDGRVDKAVHNPNRLMRLPGLTNTKGKASPERPHRPCKIESVPAETRCVTLRQLQELAGVAEEKAPPKAPAAERRTPPPSAAANDPRRLAYLTVVAEAELGVIAGAPKGERNKLLNKAAYSLYRYAHGGEWTRAELDPLIRDAARASGLYDDPGCGERGVEATMNSAYTAATEKPKTVPPPSHEPGPKVEIGGGAKAKKQADDAPDDSEVTWSVSVDDVEVDAGTAADLVTPKGDGKGGPRVYQIYTLAGLMERQFPEPRWAVPGLLSEGLNILAGRPKLGKSILALNLGITIAGGGMAMRQTKCEVGDVLYLSLEDMHRRVKSRAAKMTPALGVATSRRLSVATSWPRLDAGGLALIERWVKRCERPALVIIDVWGVFKPPSKPGGNQYEQDYENMNAVKQLMDRHRCAALVLHHCRKSGADGKGDAKDALEEVSGTMGLTGAADGIVVLGRTRNDSEAKIIVTGRDVPEQELALRFHKDSLTWENLGDAEKIVEGKLQKKVLEYLKSRGGMPAFVKEIAEMVDEGQDAVRPTLHRLQKKGLIRQEGRAWTYPGEESATTVPDETSF